MRSSLCCLSCLGDKSICRRPLGDRPCGAFAIPGKASSLVPAFSYSGIRILSRSCLISVITWTFWPPSSDSCLVTSSSSFSFCISSVALSSPSFSDKSSTGTCFCLGGPPFSPSSSLCISDIAKSFSAPSKFTSPSFSSCSESPTTRRFECRSASGSSPMTILFFFFRRKPVSTSSEDAKFPPLEPNSRAYFGEVIFFSFFLLIGVTPASSPNPRLDDILCSFFLPSLGVTEDITGKKSLLVASSTGFVCIAFFEDPFGNFFFPSLGVLFGDFIAPLSSLPSPDSTSITSLSDFFWNFFVPSAGAPIWHLTTFFFSSSSSLGAKMIFFLIFFLLKTGDANSLCPKSMDCRS